MNLTPSDMNRFHRIRLPVFLLAVAGLLSLASSKRGEAVLVSFHMETSKEDYPKFAQAVKMGNPAQQFYFKLSPVVTDQDIVWFYPFISEDGVTYGAAFKLSNVGTNRLTNLTSEPANRGRLLAANVQPVSSRTPPVRTFLQIDRRITDGTLVVWKGLTDEHLRVFTKQFGHVRDYMGAN